MNGEMIWEAENKQMGTLSKKDREGEKEKGRERNDIKGERDRER